MGPTGVTLSPTDHSPPHMKQIMGMRANSILATISRKPPRRERQRILSVAIGETHVAALRRIQPVSPNNSRGYLSGMNAIRWVCLLFVLHEKFIQLTGDKMTPLRLFLFFFWNYFFRKNVLFFPLRAHFYFSLMNFIFDCLFLSPQRIRRTENLIAIKGDPNALKKPCG